MRTGWAVCKGGGFCLLCICIQRRLQRIGQPENLFQGPPHGLVELVAGEELGCLVDGLDGAMQVGGDDGIAPGQMGRYPRGPAVPGSEPAGCVAGRWR